MTVNGAITTSFFRPPSDTRSKELLLLPCDITSSSFLPCLVLPFLEILPPHTHPTSSLAREYNFPSRPFVHSPARPPVSLVIIRWMCCYPMYTHNTPLSQQAGHPSILCCQTQPPLTPTFRIRSVGRQMDRDGVGNDRSRRRRPSSVPAPRITIVVAVGWWKDEYSGRAKIWN